MNERVRVRLSIVVWTLVAAAVVACVIYVGGQRVLPPASDDAVPVAADTAESSMLAHATPEEVGMDGGRLARIETIVERYIELGLMPGAVVGVMRHDKVAYLRAFGNREVVDSVVPMTLDTHFDLASLTKPVATATAVMQLVERGELRLNDRVERYIPDFGGWVDEEDKRDTTHIRLLELLTHTSGLPAYVSPKHLCKLYADTCLSARAALIDYIAHVERVAKPRTECVYSCLNFIALAEIVSRVAERPFEEYVAAEIFEPLGMHNTRFLPDTDYAECSAPTTPNSEGVMLRGVVHDPLAREVMGGVSGNAGLFSTVDDMLIFARMMLNEGRWGDAEILSQRAVEALFLEPRGFEEWDRTIGWESFKGYSGSAGDLLSPAAIGHTGATGTSLIIDPELDLTIVILTNKVHRTCSAEHIVELRSRVANIVGASIVE